MAPLKDTVTYQQVLASFGLAVVTFFGSYGITKSVPVSVGIAVAVLVSAILVAWIFRLHRRVSELESDMQKLRVLNPWLFESPTKDSRLMDNIWSDDGD